MTESYPNSAVRTRTTISEVPHTHDHQIFVDASGNGWTSADGSEGTLHKHKITAWVVQSTKGHTHDMTQPYDKLKQGPGRTAQTALRNKAR